MVIFAVRLFKTIGTLLVYSLVMLHVFPVMLQETRATLHETPATKHMQHYKTVPTVYQSSKTVKNSQTAK